MTLEYPTSGMVLGFKCHRSGLGIGLGLTVIQCGFELYEFVAARQVLDDVYDYVTSSVGANSDEALETPRRLKVTQGHGNRDDVGSTRRRHKANVRERSRMRSINAAFDRLRALLPPPKGCQTVTKADQRWARWERCGPSKVETLRLAVAYIGCLTRLVRSADQNSRPLSPPDDLHSDALTSVIVVQSQLHPTRHPGQSRHPHISAEYYYYFVIIFYLVFYHLW